MKLLTIENFCLEARGISRFQGADMAFEQKRGYRIVSNKELNAVYFIKAIAGILPHHERQGTIRFRDMDIYGCCENELKEIKREMVYIFREGTLIANLTVKENLLLPVQHLYPEKNISYVMDRVHHHLRYFGLANILDRRPAQLSYAAKKKISFVRTALLEPKLILMDKPMFNLETHDREPVIQFFRQLKEQGVTFIIVTQFPSLLSGLIDETILMENVSHNLGDSMKIKTLSPQLIEEST